MTFNARHVTEEAHVIVNGRRVPAIIRKGEEETISIELDSLPPNGLHFLQVQNAHGHFSNDFIFHVADKAGDIAKSLQQDPDQLRNDLENAIQSGSLPRVKRLLNLGAPINRLHHENGMTPLASAAFHGKPSLIALFLEQKSDLKKTNRDGNTTLHIAAFMCRTEVVKLLLKNGASLTARNHRRETPLDVVSGDWSEPLAGLYQFLNTSAELKLDLAGIQKQRTQVVDLLHKHMTK